MEKLSFENMVDGDNLTKRKLPPIEDVVAGYGIPIAGAVIGYLANSSILGASVGTTVSSGLIKALDSHEGTYNSVRESGQNTGIILGLTGLAVYGLERFFS